MISVLEKLIIDDRRATGKQEQYQICYAVLFQNVANSVGGTGRMLTEAKHSNLFFKKKEQRDKDSAAQKHGCQGHVIHPVTLDFFIKSQLWEHLSGPTNLISLNNQKGDFFLFIFF